MSQAALLIASGLGVRLAGRVVLNDVSLKLSAGHLVALVGPNGAGKTTLLRALAGLIPSEGAIEIGGQALASLPLRERAKRFGYLPQGHVVHWPLPARDIVALGRYPHGATDPARLSPADAEAVLRAMQAVDIMAFSDRRVTELSGGERSRVALARALAVEAPVMLADEPTASLDPRHQIDVMKNLRATADNGVLVIVVTHDLGVAARFADHVLVLCEGRLVSQGAPAEALSRAGDGRCVQGVGLSRGIPARDRDRAVGGYLMRRLKLPVAVLALAFLCGGASAATLPRLVSMNVCTDQLLLRLADPEQILGLSRFSRDGWQSQADLSRYPVLSGGAEDVLLIRPDIVVASAFDKRATRELLKAKGLRLAELAVPRTLDEARQQIREAGEITGHPDRAAAEIARLDAALARARRAVSERHYRVLPLSRRGWVAGSDSFVGSLLGDIGLRSAAGDLGFAHGGFASLEAIVDLRPTSSWCRRPATRLGMTARHSCCTRRCSASIRRKSAS